MKRGKAAEKSNDLAELPAWLARMRRVAMDSITEKDVQDIVRKQIERAKKGDRHAIKFVFDYILGTQQFKGAKFVQNVFHGKPDEPTAMRPGTGQKLQKMCGRAAVGLPLCDEQDGPADVDLR